MCVYVCEIFVIYIHLIIQLIKIRLSIKLLKKRIPELLMQDNVGLKAVTGRKFQTL